MTLEIQGFLREKLHRAFVGALISGVVLALYLLLPLRTSVQIGADEGFELAKAILCLHGHDLYREVWNDQPPLHSFIITQVLRHISPSILGPRLVTTMFTVLLLLSVFGIVRRLSGLFAATMTTGLLIVSPGFVELSSSCMLEIPALALAVAALGLLFGDCRRVPRLSAAAPRTRNPSRPLTRLGGARIRSRPPRDLRSSAQVGTPGDCRGALTRTALAGALFGAALMIKLDTLMYLPLAGLILWVCGMPREKHPSDSQVGSKRASGKVPPLPLLHRRELLRRLVPFLVFGGSLAASVVAIDWFIDHGAFLGHLQQTWISHFAPAKSFDYGSAADHPFEPGILLKNWDTSIPAPIGLLACLVGARKKPRLSLPVAWLLLTLVVFAVHRPWWSYYYVHIAVPLCWCASMGVQAVWERVWTSQGCLAWVLLVMYVLSGLAWMTGRVYLQIGRICQSPQTYSSLLLTEITHFKPFAQWFFTDEPIYSFHADIPMPPPLAVLPLKRLWSGDITNARIDEELRKFKPGLMLLRNDSHEKPFQAFLNYEYQLVYVDGEHLLYADRAIAKKTIESGSSGNLTYEK